MFVLQFLLVAAIKFLPKLVHILEPVIVPFSQNVRTSRFLAREYHAAPSQSSASFGNTCTWTTNEGPKHCQEQRQPLAPQAVPRPCNEKEEAPKEQSRPEETFYASAIVASPIGWRNRAPLARSPNGWRKCGRKKYGRQHGRQDCCSLTFSPARIAQWARTSALEGGRTLHLMC